MANLRKFHFHAGEQGREALAPRDVMPEGALAGVAPEGAGAEIEEAMAAKSFHNDEAAARHYMNAIWVQEQQGPLYEITAPESPEVVPSLRLGYRAGVPDDEHAPAALRSDRPERAGPRRQGGGRAQHGPRPRLHGCQHRRRSEHRSDRHVERRRRAGPRGTEGRSPRRRPRQPAGGTRRTTRGTWSTRCGGSRSSRPSSSRPWRARRGTASVPRRKGT